MFAGAFGEKAERTGGGEGSVGVKVGGEFLRGEEQELLLADQCSSDREGVSERRGGGYGMVGEQSRGDAKPKGGRGAGIVRFRTSLADHGAAGDTIREESTSRWW